MTYNNTYSRSGICKFSIPHSQFLIVVFLIVFLPSSILSSRKYNPFVWTTYKEFSHFYSITLNMEKVYFGTDDGILQYNRIKKQWEEPITKSNDFPGVNAKIVAFDRMFNKLWIISDNALIVYNPNIFHWEREIPRISIPIKTITSIGFTQDSIYLEGNGVVYASQRGMYSWTKWNGTPPATIEWSGELGKIKLEDFTFLTPYYATDEYFNKYAYTAATADNKDMWLGTNGFSVFLYNLFTWNGIHYTVGLASNRVDAIFRDRDGFWLGGTQSKGITHINFQTGEGKHYQSEYIFRLNSHDINAITGDEQNLWFGTNAGLQKYERDEDDWTEYTQFHGLPGNAVIALQQKEDTLFIGTDNGMAYLLPGLRDVVSIKEFDNIPIYAFGVYNNNLIICSEEGVFVRKSDTIEVITDPDGDFSFGVTTVYVDNNMLWFGTRRNGIDVYNIDSLEWQEYLSPTPVSGEWIFDIKGHKDFIWIATNNGVTRYNKQTDTWYTFDESDGLAHNDVRTIYVEDNYVWFGTRNGLTRFSYTDSSVPQ